METLDTAVVLEEIDNPYEEQVVLHKYQSYAYDTTARFIALIAGTGGGKTFLGPVWLANEIAQHPGDQWLVVAPTYKILSRATAPTLVNFFKGTTLEGVWTESKGIYKLPCGGIIYCISSDKWQSIEGGQYRAAWVDEAGQMNRMVWIALQARLGLKQGRCLFTTTPYPTRDADWLQTEILAKFEEGDPAYFVTRYSSKDNPHYPDEEYERARASMSEALFKMRYDGYFTKMSGLVYQDLDTCYVGDDPLEVMHLAVEESWELYGGADWGFKDPTVFLIGAVDPTGVLWLVHEHYRSRATLQSHCRDLDPAYSPASFAEGFDPADAMIYADPSGAQQALECAQHGIYVQSADNDILEGIDAVTWLIEQKRLKICVSGFDNLKREGALYRYPAEEEEGAAARRANSEKPIDAWNHTMDALRYLCQGIRSFLMDYELEEEPEEEKTDEQKKKDADTAHKEEQERGGREKVASTRAAHNIPDDEEWCSADNDELFS
jgi:hypothetical protein